MLRRDLDDLVAARREAGLYSTLVTAGTLLTRERAERLKEARLDHVQVSIQSPDPEENDRIAGNRSFEEKIAAARAARELRLPLTVNCVLHRENLDRIEELLALAEELDAQRLELADTRYYGWAVVNQQALLPTRDQLERGEEAVQRFRARVGPRITMLWVLPDYFEDLPKPCMAGWGRTVIVLAPNGDAMPCQAASTIPDLAFPNVRDPAARRDLERGGRVRALPRHGLDAGAVPLVSARAPGGGLGRLPLPGAPPHRRRPRPPIPYAGSRRTTVPSSQPANRRRRTSPPTGRSGSPRAPDRGVAPSPVVRSVGGIRLVSCRHG